jgi:hypothetical protein
MSFTPYLEIGFDKNGEADFRAHMTVQDLDHKRMTELRAMIPVAIAELECLWSYFGPPSKMMQQGQAAQPKL